MMYFVKTANFSHFQLSLSVDCTLQFLKEKHPYLSKPTAAQICVSFKIMRLLNRYSVDKHSILSFFKGKETNGTL